MAQKTFTSAVLTSADVNTYLMHEGGAWTSWTPVVTQGATPTLTNVSSTYARASRTIHFRSQVTITSNGTAANNIVLSLPVASATAGQIFGNGILIDASSGLLYPFMLAFNATTTVLCYSPALSGSATISLGAAGFTAALANGDSIFYTGTYESAS
jgi:hypothetical protein